MDETPHSMTGVDFGSHVFGLTKQRGIQRAAGEAQSRKGQRRFGCAIVVDQPNPMDRHGAECSGINAKGQYELDRVRT
jgi:hypothetical protein